MNEKESWSFQQFEEPKAMTELISDIYSDPEKREKFEKMLQMVEHDS